MGRVLFTITPSILATAREYLELSRAGQHSGIHVADCFPVPPEQIVETWDNAEFDLLLRGEDKNFRLASVTLFKSGRVAAQYDNLSDPGPMLPLFPNEE